MIDKFLPEWFATAHGREDLALILALVAAVAAVAAALPAAVGFVKWCRRWARAWYVPFAFGEGDATRVGEKAWTIPAGVDATVRVAVWPRRATRFRLVDVRCVETSWGSWGLRNRNVSPDVIEIVGVTDEVNKWTAHQDLGTDDRGGRYFRYDPHYDCPLREGLCLTITIRAKQRWRGYLGIRNMFGDAVRDEVHLPLTVTA